MDFTALHRQSRQICAFVLERRIPRVDPSQDLVKTRDLAKTFRKQLVEWSEEI